MRPLKLVSALWNSTRVDAGRGMELANLKRAASYGHAQGLTIVAGHGLNYDNISPVVQISEIVEFNIGHSIMARAMLVGMDRAVAEMVRLVRG